MKRGTALLVGFCVAAFAGGQNVDAKRSPGQAKGSSSADSVLSLNLLQPVSTCQTYGQIPYGTTISGTLSVCDCQFSSDNSFVDYFQFQGQEGQTVSIDLSSTDFDAYLFLLDPASNEVAKNNNFSGTDSHITFNLTSSGTWTIAANSALGNQTGYYELSLALVTSPPVPVCGDTTSLCLTGDRFLVAVAWHTTDGRSGEGQAIPLSGDTGYFWFFNASNVELVVKVLDGRTINGHFWVFYGALSDVQYVITVTDRTNGATRSYTNPQGNLASFADTAAF
jgi:Bacterial pre-peptidase C-terminal domain